MLIWRKTTNTKNVLIWLSHNISITKWKLNYCYKYDLASQFWLLRLGIWLEYVYIYVHSTNNKYIDVYIFCWQCQFGMFINCCWMCVCVCVCVYISVLPFSFTEWQIVLFWEQLLYRVFKGWDRFFFFKYVFDMSSQIWYQSCIALCCPKISVLLHEAKTKKNKKECVCVGTAHVSFIVHIIQSFHLSSFLFCLYVICFNLKQWQDKTLLAPMWCLLRRDEKMRTVLNMRTDRWLFKLIFFLIEKKKKENKEVLNKNPVVYTVCVCVCVHACLFCLP